uniref:Alpha-toxin To2 n=2 Tax=Tityus TaxID=6886 RepID=SCX2_TITOB|nr:RecName: Full=Alpha-toxin To2; AltName: Full=Alpha-toxin Tc48a; AltName: Full=Alpha-toxin To48a; AltName: Full=PT-alpha' NaTx11.1; Flags: Precursor [Tityus obscurus]WDU65889.1 putative NaTx Tcis44 [Tityus cisandinus]CCD31419.1 scorpion toxin Tc48a precursor [Tityus obscurus]
MIRFVLFISCFFLIGTVVECNKDGYLMEGDGCKMGCLTRKASYCVDQCKEVGGKDGYCYAWLSCYCYNMPDSVEIWDSKNNKCGKGK